MLTQALDRTPERAHRRRGQAAGDSERALDAPREDDGQSFIRGAVPEGVYLRLRGQLGRPTRSGRRDGSLSDGGRPADGISERTGRAGRRAVRPVRSSSHMLPGGSQATSSTGGSAPPYVVLRLSTKLPISSPITVTRYSCPASISMTARAWPAGVAAEKSPKPVVVSTVKLK